MARGSLPLVCPACSTFLDLPHPMATLEWPPAGLVPPVLRYPCPRCHQVTRVALMGGTTVCPQGHTHQAAPEALAIFLRAEGVWHERGPEEQDPRRHARPSWARRVLGWRDPLGNTLRELERTPCTDLAALAELGR